MVVDKCFKEKRCHDCGGVVLVRKKHLRASRRLAYKQPFFHSKCWRERAGW